MRLSLTRLGVPYHCPVPGSGTRFRLALLAVTCRDVGRVNNRRSIHDECCCHPSHHQNGDDREDKIYDDDDDGDAGDDDDADADGGDADDDDDGDGDADADAADGDDDDDDDDDDDGDCDGAYSSYYQHHRFPSLICSRMSL